MIVEHGDARPFDRFDRLAQFKESTPRTLDSLLDEFARLRRENLEELTALGLAPRRPRSSRPPSGLGPVTLRQLLATWTAHDLDHVMQISRVLTRRSSDEVGPWRAYLRIISGVQG